MAFFSGVLTFLAVVLLPSTGWTAATDQATTTMQKPSQSTPARSLTRVDLKKSAGEATIIMAGNGPLPYRIRSLDADRVIVDLVNVSTKLGHAFEFDHPLVKQIRIGQHPSMLRLVIDVRQPVAYSVQEAASTLLVTLFPRASAKQPAGAAQHVEPISRSQDANIAGLPEAPKQTQSEQTPKIESNRSAIDAREHQEARKRAVDRRVIDQSVTQPATERYVAVFGGVTMPQPFQDVHFSDEPSFTFTNLDLARSAVVGAKLGFSPSSAKWLAMETELFYTSPHVKQQSSTLTGPGGSLPLDFSGSRIRMTTWALNWILRYPGEVIQPYAGVGIGIFWARLSDVSGSGADTSPGLNALAGLKFVLGKHVVIFGEYKYNRASFDFGNDVGLHTLYQAHHLVGGLGFQF